MFQFHRCNGRKLSLNFVHVLFRDRSTEDNKNALLCVHLMLAFSFLVEG